MSLTTALVRAFMVTNEKSSVECDLVFRVTWGFSEGFHHSLVPSLDRILVVYPLRHSSLTLVTLRLFVLSLYTPQTNLFDDPLHVHLECAAFHKNMNTTFKGGLKRAKPKRAEQELWGWGPADVWADFHFTLSGELFCPTLPTFFLSS